MDAKDLQHLKELAQAATPGPWFVQHGDDIRHCCMTAISNVNARSRNEGMFDEQPLVAVTFHQTYPLVNVDGDDDDCGDKDSAYIAAANPAAILELIALAEKGMQGAQAVPAGWRIDPTENCFAVYSPSGDAVCLTPSDAHPAAEVLRQLCQSLLAAQPVAQTEVCTTCNDVGMVGTNHENSMSCPDCTPVEKILPAPVASKEAVSEQTPVGYVHLVPDEYSKSYDVRFWAPVAMGTKLYAQPIAAPTTAAEGVPSVDTPELRAILGPLMMAYRDGEDDDALEAALIAHLNADKAAAVAKARNETSMQIDAAVHGMQNPYVGKSELAIYVNAYYRALIDVRAIISALHSQEAAKPSEGSGDDRSKWTTRQWAEHVGAWENEKDEVCFGSWMALRAMLLQFQKMTIRAARAQPAEPVTAAARDVLAERQRQVAVEGWTPEHDDQYQNDELSLAAACYAIASDTALQTSSPNMWPWPEDWWKPTTERRNLVKAGALILAEIERLDRAERITK